MFRTNDASSSKRPIRKNVAARRIRETLQAHPRVRHAANHGRLDQGRFFSSFLRGGGDCRGAGRGWFAAGGFAAGGRLGCTVLGRGWTFGLPPIGRGFALGRSSSIRAGFFAGLRGSRGSRGSAALRMPGCLFGPRSSAAGRIFSVFFARAVFGGRFRFAVRGLLFA